MSESMRINWMMNHSITLACRITWTTIDCPSIIALDSQTKFNYFWRNNCSMWSLLTLRACSIIPQWKLAVFSNVLSVQSSVCTLELSTINWPWEVWSSLYWFREHLMHKERMFISKSAKFNITMWELLPVITHDSDLGMATWCLSDGSANNVLRPLPNKGMHLHGSLTFERQWLVEWWTGYPTSCSPHWTQPFPPSSLKMACSFSWPMLHHTWRALSWPQWCCRVPR